MSVDVKKVAGRRIVHYGTLQDLLGDAERLAAGPGETNGNKTYPEILKHMAIVANWSIDGFPVRPPGIIRLLGRIFKRRVLATGLRPGVKLPADAEAVLWPPEVSVAAGLEELRGAFRRLEIETKRAPHPFLGPLSREDWDEFHMRHAEMHMSFVKSIGAAP